MLFSHDNEQDARESTDLTPGADIRRALRQADWNSLQAHVCSSWPVDDQVGSEWLMRRLETDDYALVVHLLLVD